MLPPDRPLAVGSRRGEAARGRRGAGRGPPPPARTGDMFRSPRPLGDELAAGRQEVCSEAALSRHAAHAGRAFDPETGATQNVRDGQASRLDTLLNSTYARTPPCDYEHPVVELKRSSVKLGSAELNQVESDALTVGQDDRFDKQRTKWTW